MPELVNTGNVKASPSGGGLRLDVAANDLITTGTFAPTLGADPTDPTSVTYATRDGYYLKIGQLVFFTLRIVTTARSGGSGPLRIKNLPYACASALSPGAQVSGRLVNVSYTSGQALAFDVVSGTNQLRVAAVVAGGAATNIPIANWPANGDIWASGVYVTS